MRAFHVRVTDRVHQLLKQMADARGISLADVVREALEVYAIGASYAEQGKRLTWEDPNTGEKVELLIPGFTRPNISLASLVKESKRRRSS